MRTPRRNGISGAPPLPGSDRNSAEFARSLIACPCRARPDCHGRASVASLAAMPPATAAAYPGSPSLRAMIFATSRFTSRQIIVKGQRTKGLPSPTQASSTIHPDQLGEITKFNPNVRTGCAHEILPADAVGLIRQIDPVDPAGRYAQDTSAVAGSMALAASLRMASHALVSSSRVFMVLVLLDVAGVRPARITHGVLVLPVSPRPTFPIKLLPTPFF